MSAHEQDTLPTPARWRGWLKSAAQGLGAAAFGGISTFLLIRYADGLAPEGTAKLMVLAVVLVALIAAVWLHLIAHELGHALGARCYGGTLLRLLIGKSLFHRRRSGYRHQRIRGIKAIGGFAQSVLPVDERFNRAMVAMLLGGPLANLLIAGLMLPVVQIDWAPWPLRVAGIGLVGFGLFLGLVNLIPFRTGGFLTDGAQLLRFLREPGHRERARAVMRLARASLDGLRPREYPAEDLACFDTDASDPADRFAALYLHSAHAYDTGNVERARVLVGQALSDWERWPDGFRQHFAALAALLALEVDRDAETGRREYERARHGLLEEFQTSWLEALLADLESRHAEQAEALKRLEAALADTLLTGDARFYRERLERFTAGVSAAAT
jgi:uncharacterized coiled-coil protein SlyX